MAQKTKWTEEQKKDIIFLYQKGYSFSDIGKKYYKDGTVIKKVILEAGIPIRTANETKQLKKNLPSLTTEIELTEEIKQQILEKYVVDKKSIYQIQKETNLSQFIIEKILKELNVQKRTYVDAKQLSRKYEVNDNYFKIQSHNMAYILGLLASDGNVARDENKISLELEETDSYLLDNINSLVGNTRPIKYYVHKHNNGTETKAAKIQVWSAEWKKDLAIYNIVPVKTKILKPPTFLDKKYYISYLKGYFDGDGSIYYNLNIKKWSLNFCGASYDVIKWIHDIFINDYGIVVGKVEEQTLETGNKFYRFYLTNKSGLKKIYQMWYQDETSSICLSRKQEKFEKLIEYFCSN